jgi:hypothetical protein
MQPERPAPLGHQYALAMLEGGETGVRQLAIEASNQLAMDAFLRVQDEEPVPAFLHSALCAMSLPTKRPKDETAPILREDGKYALAISPRPVIQSIDGKTVVRSLGVPYGAYPRVALIYLLSQAVTKRSRDVYLGRNFTEWMRRLGYETISYGPRGTASLMREQVDRLLACEWQIRWEGQGDDAANAFAVRDVKISNEYAGSLDKDGAFAREIRMSEVFYNHLVEHAVPLNEIAVRELRTTPTALDLYTYLAYRLPRISNPRGQMISWDQLASHLGNSSDTKRFRQTVRDTWNIVSAVYPNANVDLSGKRIVLHPSPAPLEKKLVGPHLRLVGADSAGGMTNKAQPSVEAAPQITAQAKTLQPLLAFPTGTLRYGSREQAFYDIGLRKGRPWDVDQMAAEFRKGFAGIETSRKEVEWLRIWEGFVVRYAERRKETA